MGAFAAFMASVTWAIGSSVYSRLALSSNAYSVNFTRSLLAFPFFLAVVIATVPHPLQGIDPEALQWLSLSVIASYGFGDVIFFGAASLLGVPGALAIGSIYPAWAAFVGAYSRGEGLHASQWAGLAITLAFLILVILTTPRAGARTTLERSRRRVVIGTLLAILTSFMWATNSVSVSHAGLLINPWLGNVFRMLLGMGMSQVVGALVLRKRIRMVPWAELKPVAWIFVFEAFAGSYFYLYGLSHTPLAVGSTLSSLAPVLAVPIAWALKSEKVRLVRLASVSGVVFGLWLLVQ